MIIIIMIMIMIMIMIRKRDGRLKEKCRGYA